IKINKRGTIKDKKLALSEDINKIKVVLESSLANSEITIPIQVYDKIDPAILILRKNFKFGQLPPRLLELPELPLSKWNMFDNYIPRW
ncbi:4728_t:CDS:1, partial [Gigaspora rosea]